MGTPSLDTQAHSLNPDNVGCLYKYSVQYNRLVQQYASTIKAHFFGHTHDDSVPMLHFGSLQKCKL